MVQTQTSDIVFFHTGSWLARMIRKIAKIKYNHVGIVVHVWGVPMLYEAVGRGVICTPLDDRIKGQQIKVCRLYKESDEQRYAVEASLFLGKTPYDFVGLLWHQLILNITGIYIGRTRTAAATSFYCYEYAAYMNRNEVPEWEKVIPRFFESAAWHHTIFEGTA